MKRFTQVNNVSFVLVRNGAGQDGDMSTDEMLKCVSRTYSLADSFGFS